MREKDRLKKIGNFVKVRCPLPSYVYVVPKANTYKKKTIIRIRFPNRVELQGTFHPREKPTSIVAFIKERLEHPDLDFYLCKLVPFPTPLPLFSLPFSL